MWTWCCLDTSVKATIQLYISIADKWKLREVCLHFVLGGLNKGDVVKKTCGFVSVTCNDPFAIRFNRQSR